MNKKEDTITVDRVIYDNLLKIYEMLPQVLDNSVQYKHDFDYERREHEVIKQASDNVSNRIIEILDSITKKAQGSNEQKK